MTRKNFITLISGVTGGLVFAIGMCMCLLPEWNMFRPGVVVSAVGAFMLIALAVVMRRMSGKAAGKPDWKLIGKVMFGVFAALVLGLGMCMIMVWNMMLPGIIIGVVGILLLVCLIPVVKGLE